MVLVAAKSKTTALHKCFEWDDTKAGREYRLIQARRIIRTATITIDKKEDTFVHVPKIGNKGEGVYKPLSIVVKTLDDYTLALESALSKLRAAQRAVSDLKSAASGKPKSAVSKVAYALSSLSSAHEALQSLH